MNDTLPPPEDDPAGVPKTFRQRLNEQINESGKPDGALMAFKSHVEGRNARVTVWPDRIEWTRHRMLGRDDTNTILTRSVTGIKTHKGGLQYTTVSIQSGASSVAMKVTKAQAAELRRIVRGVRAEMR